MKFAKKYVLIDQDSYQRLNQTTLSKDEAEIFEHPDVTVAKKEQMHMQTIADNKELTDTEKLQLHSQALKRYLESFKDAVTFSKEQALTGSKDNASRMKVENALSSSSASKSDIKEEQTVKTPVTTKPFSNQTQEIEATEMKKLTVDKILKTLPNKQRVAGRKLLRDLKKVENLKWLDDGRVIYHGKVIKDSDLSLLVSDTVGGSGTKQSKTFPRSKFGKILTEHGIRSNQVGSGFHDYNKFCEGISRIKWVKHKWNISET